MYLEDRVLVTFRVRLCCDGEGEIEIRAYREAWVTSMVTAGVWTTSQGEG